MRKYFLYLLISLLAFAIGVSIALSLTQEPENPKNITPEFTPSFELTTKSNPQINEPEKLKYGCQEKALETFWEKLDKKTFVDFKKLVLKEHHKDSPEMFREQRKNFVDNFNCSYFHDLQEIDLNDDGESELWLEGECFGREGCETFIFKKQKNNLRMIFFDFYNIENDIWEAETKGYLNLTFITNWTAGERTITIYVFDGNIYKAKHCFSHKQGREMKGDVTSIGSATTRRITCDALTNILK